MLLYCKIGDSNPIFLMFLTPERSKYLDWIKVFWTTRSKNLHRSKYFGLKDQSISKTMVPPPKNFRKGAVTGPESLQPCRRLDRQGTSAGESFVLSRMCRNENALQTDTKCICPTEDACVLPTIHGFCNQGRRAIRLRWVRNPDPNYSCFDVLCCHIRDCIFRPTRTLCTLQSHNRHNCPRISCMPLWQVTNYGI